MATEEQTSHNAYTGLQQFYRKRAGQRLTIPNREVTKLSFPLYKTGSPTGNVTFTIRKVSDDSIIASKVWGNASALSGDITWYEATLDSPVTVNEEVRILVEFASGDSDSSNYVCYRYQNTDVKASEQLTRYVSSYNDVADSGYDGAYIYTYTGGVTHNLAGVSVGVASVSGVLEGLTRSLAGTIAGVASVSGILGVFDYLAGIVNGIATVAGNLPVTHKLVGTIAGIASVTGNLTKGYIEYLAGAVSGVASVTATLSIAGIKDLVGIISGAASVVGDLGVTHKLAGNVAGVASVVGDLTRTGWQYLAGVVAGICSISRVEDFTTYTEVDPNEHIDLVGTNHIDFDAWMNEDAYIYKDKGVDHFGDFEHLIAVKIISVSDTWSQAFIWTLQNRVDTVSGIAGEYEALIAINIVKSPGLNEIMLVEYYTTPVYYQENSWVYAAFDTWYYLTIKKVGTSLTCKIYSDSARTTLITTLSLTLHADHKFRYIFSANVWNNANARHYTIDIENLNLHPLIVKVTRRIAGSIAGVASVAGNLTTGYIQFIKGVVTGVATVAGVVSITKKLTGTSAGIAVVSGATKVLHKLAGISAGVASVVGNLVAPGRILIVKIITTQYRKVKPITTQYRKVKPVTTTYRKVNPITTLYRKIKAITSGG